MTQHKWWNPPNAPNWLAYGLGDCSIEARQIEVDFWEGFWIVPQPIIWLSFSSIVTCKVAGCEEGILGNEIHWDEELQLQYGLANVCPEHCQHEEFERDYLEGGSFCTVCYIDERYTEGYDPYYEPEDW